MFGDDFLQRAMLFGPIILFSLTVHEFAHAWSAHKFGDDTARRLGRMSLNPLVHLDLFGTIVMVMSGFRFGWAKPVPVNPFNLRNPRKADLWISAAGPISNILIALAAGLVYRVAGGFAGNEALDSIFTYAVQINITLAIFNLLPLFPLDGSHILRTLLPPRYEPLLEQFSRFAPFVLILLVVTGALWLIIGPPIILVSRFILY